MDGTPFGRYRLIELLGRGGMGEVWRAFDTVTERVVALKVLPAEFADDETFQQRFRREARSAAGLDEPHVVPIYDFGEIDGRLFVTMRLIQGHDLLTLLADGPLDPTRAVYIIDQVASALHAAHRIDLVHRDVKPSNILVAEDDFTYLIDFGIARSSGDTSLTHGGGIVGSFAYLSPERLTNGRSDHRADIYALTCVLHECLTGSQPFPGSSLEQQVGNHLAKPPPRPSTLRANLPAELDRVIAKGMAKNPDDRYGTTKELIAEARAAITAPLPKPAPPPAPQPPPLPPKQSGSDEQTVRAPYPAPQGNQPKTPGVYSPYPTPPRVAPFAQPAVSVPNLPSTPPATPKPGSSQVRVWAGIAAVVVVLAIVAAVVIVRGRNSDSTNAVSPAPTTTTSAAPLVARDALNGLLLSADAINEAMGATKLTDSGGRHAIGKSPVQITPVECRVVHALDVAAYTGSAWTDSLQEEFVEDPANHWIDQAVVRFPSATSAAAFVENSLPKWSACANATYTVKWPNSEPAQWTSGPVSSALGTISINLKGNGWSCQQALTSANNIVVNVSACNYGLTGEGITIAEQIAANVPK